MSLHQSFTSTSSSLETKGDEKPSVATQPRKNKLVMRSSGYTLKNIKEEKDPESQALYQLLMAHLKDESCDLNYCEHVESWALVSGFSHAEYDFYENKYHASFKLPVLNLLVLNYIQHAMMMYRICKRTEMYFSNEFSNGDSAAYTPTWYPTAKKDPEEVKEIQQVLDLRARQIKTLIQDYNADFYRLVFSEEDASYPMLILPEKTEDTGGCNLFNLFSVLQKLNEYKPTSHTAKKLLQALSSIPLGDFHRPLEFFSQFKDPSAAYRLDTGLDVIFRLSPSYQIDFTLLREIPNIPLNFRPSASHLYAERSYFQSDFITLHGAIAGVDILSALKKLFEEHYDWRVSGFFSNLKMANEIVCLDAVCKESGVTAFIYSILLEKRIREVYHNRPTTIEDAMMHIFYHQIMQIIHSDIENFLKEKNEKKFLASITEKIKVYAKQVLGAPPKSITTDVVVYVKNPGVVHSGGDSLRKDISLAEFKSAYSEANDSLQKNVIGYLPGAILACLKATSFHQLPEDIQAHLKKVGFDFEKLLAEAQILGNQRTTPAIKCIDTKYMPLLLINPIVRQDELKSLALCKFSVASKQSHFMFDISSLPYGRANFLLGLLQSAQVLSFNLYSFVALMLRNENFLRVITDDNRCQTREQRLFIWMFFYIAKVEELQEQSGFTKTAINHLFYRKLASLSPSLVVMHARQKGAPPLPLQTLHAAKWDRSYSNFLYQLSNRSKAYSLYKRHFIHEMHHVLRDEKPFFDAMLGLVLSKIPIAVVRKIGEEFLCAQLGDKDARKQLKDIVVGRISAILTERDERIKQQAAKKRKLNPSGFFNNDAGATPLAESKVVVSNIRP